MTHYLVRPACCKTCPFKGGFHLFRSRRLKVYEDVVERDLSFPCHSEVEYADQDYGEVVRNLNDGARHCAGAATLGVRTDDHTQIMRIAGRLGEALPNDPNVPFQNWDEWINEPYYSMERTGS